MEISGNTYESWIIDYFDGKLSEKEIRELMHFLELNPEAKTAFAEFHNMKLVPESIPFPGKDLLKKDLHHKTTINDNNFAEFAIAWHEHLLEENRKKELQQYLFLHPEKKSEFNDFAKVYLKPDLSVLYPHKNRLRRGRKRTFSSWIVNLSMAASVLLLIGLFIGLGKDFFRSDDYQQSTMEESKPEKYNSSLVTKGKGNARQNASMIEKATEPMRSKTHYKHSRQQTAKLEIPSQTANESIHPITTISPVGISQLGAFTSIELPIHRKNTHSQASSKKDQEDFMSLKDYAIKEFSEKVLAKKTTDEKGKITFWDVTEASLKGINKITGTNIKMEKKYDESGNLIAVSVDSKAFGFSAPIKQNN